MWKRTWEHLWKEWQSWNPAWRPVWSRGVETLFRDAIAKIGKDLNIEDVERDLVTALLTKASKGDLRALEMYLDRLYGKPKNSTDITSGGEKLDINVKLNKEELNEAILNVIR